MAQTTFEVDVDTLNTMNELKQKFGVKTNAQVIRRALALAKVAARNSGDDAVLMILDKNNVPTKVLLAG